MRRRHRQNFFIGIALKSFCAIIGIIGMMVVFARTFGELAIPAIHMMAFLICIPTVTFFIGILGLFWTAWTDRADW